MWLLIILAKIKHFIVNIFLTDMFSAGYVFKSLDYSNRFGKKLVFFYCLRIHNHCCLFEQNNDVYNELNILMTQVTLYGVIIIIIIVIHIVV